MATINRYEVDGYECHRLTDTCFGVRLQYAVKLDKFTAAQWIKAHNEVMQAIDPQERSRITGRQAKTLAYQWLNSTKEARAGAKTGGISLKSIDGIADKGIRAVFESFLADFCRHGINAKGAIERAKRHCGILMDFLQDNSVREYSRLTRETMAKYPEWRNSNRRDRKKGGASADTVNQELNRMAAVIKHGVKYHGWQERYILDGIKVKRTVKNTRAVRPFELAEAKAIFGWLRNHSERIGNWHLHDMILLALCSGLEAKALHLLSRDWFKLDLGILRIYDKLVSGVIDAKTQNRARDIPLTPTMRKIYERGFVFERCSRARHKSKLGGTEFRAWAETILRKAEKDTGIAEINLHRFRHTCATARLSAGWQLVRVSRMLGHSSVNTTAQHYAEYDLSASPEGFEGMVKVYREFCEWLDEGYF